MGTNTLTSRTNGQTINDTWFNDLKTALDVDHVPRNSSGVATNEAGNLGTSSLKWMNAHISVGYWDAGDIKARHSFNGTVSVGQGWMLCDGRQITQANYDTEHGAGSWATYIGSSSLTNKYLPNLVGRYLVGKATTPQDGSIAITAVGNTSHQIDISHFHTTGNHNHQVYAVAATGSTDKGFNSSGTLGSLVVGSPKIGGAGAIPLSINEGSPLGSDLYTTMNNPNTDTKLSAAQSIQPESIEVQFYMRII